MGENGFKQEADWYRERRILLVAAALLVVTLIGAFAAIAARFENDATRLYAENIHALVGVAATQLEEGFSEAEKLVGVMAFSELTRTAQPAAAKELLQQVLAAVSHHGAIAAFLSRDDELIVFPPAGIGDEPDLLLAAGRRDCPTAAGSLCIAHAAGPGGRHLIFITGRHRLDGPHENTVAGIVIDWASRGERLVAQTKLDEWSKAFVLDRDGTLLAWPTDAKLPGFRSVDQEAGCAECHRDLLQEPSVNTPTWRSTTVDIDGDAYIVATAPVVVGTGKMTVGMVAPRSAALVRQGPVITWGVGLLLVLAFTVGFVVFRLHRLGTVQVQTIRTANEKVSRLNERLEEKVRARTEQLEAAHERTQALQRAHAVLDRQAAVGELAAVFAHEVRTPLNALSIARQRLARLVRRGEPIPPELASDVLESQGRNVEMINEYVESYLKYARQARTGVSGGVSACNLSTLLHEVFGYVEPEARRSGVELIDDVAPDDLTVTVDEGTLRHILVNLVLNAVQVQPSGGTVSVTAHAGHGHLSIEVADRGPGVPPEHASDIFEPFRSYREGGTGLGLAICQRLAKEQNASISLRDRPEGGSIFAVTWPV